MSVLNSSSSQSDFLQHLYNFLVRNEGNNLKLLYPFLKDNVNKLNNGLIPELQYLGNNLLNESNQRDRKANGLILEELGDLFFDFKEGKRIVNLELTICCYEIAKELYNQQDNPYEWATVSKKLGLAYSERIQGRDSENKKLAIEQYHLALKVFTPNAFPYEWINTKIELVKSYLKNLDQKETEYYIDGKQTNNYQQAYINLEEVLNADFFNSENYSYEYATIQLLFGRLHIEGNINNDREKDTIQAIEYYQNALQIFTSTTYPDEWATTITYLSFCYRFGLPQDAEKAIECCLPLLNVINRDDFPEVWARIQRQLGWVYRDKNPEESVRCLEVALEIFTRDFYPDDWSLTNRILGTSYFRFSQKGGGTKYLDLSIEALKKALEIYPYERSPNNWARIHKHLANTYNHHPHNRREKLRLAEAHCKKALKVLTGEDYQYEWATLQNYLGNIYRMRMRENERKNQKLALKSYLKALKVYKSMNFSRDIFKVAKNIGLLYLNTQTEDKEKSLEEAKKYFEEAEEAFSETNIDKGSYEYIIIQNHLIKVDRQLKTNKRTNFNKAIKRCGKMLNIHPQKDGKWAWTQRTLGDLYLEHPDNKKSLNYKKPNIEKAITAFQQALGVYKKLGDKEQQAQTQNNLGNAYKNRVEGDKQENLRLAIKCYESALRIHRRDYYPYQWAKIQNNLANAYRQLRGEDNTQQVVDAYDASLTIYKPEIFPYDCDRVGRNLGRFAFQKRDWQTAIKGYSRAVEATENIRSYSRTDNRRQKILKEKIEVYENLILACINEGLIDNAVEYLDRFRARQLVDIMTGKELISQSEDQQVQKFLKEYDNLQKQINDLRYQIKSSQEQNESSQLSDNQVRKARLRFQKDDEKIQELINKQEKIYLQIRELDSVLAAQLKVDPLDFETIQQQIDDAQTAILSFYTAKQDTYIFIIYQNKPPQIHLCRGQNKKDFQERFLYENWLKPYSDSFANHLSENEQSQLRQEWGNNMSGFLTKLSKRLKLNELVNNYLQGIEELIIIPNLYLHHIPFAALPLASNSLENETTEYFGDQFRLRYIPGCKVFEFCKQRQKENPSQAISFGTVENADDSLLGAEIEGAIIAEILNIPTEKRLIGSRKATIENYHGLIKEVNFLHSSHHASSNINNPLQSALELADGQITVGQLMTPRWRLPNLHHIFLACCETHLGVTNVTDDILTLTTAFLCAGARSVVSSLWVANDIASSLLSRFYYQFRQDGATHPTAMQQAQIKLRKLKGENLINFQKIIEPHLDEIYERASTDLKQYKNQIKQHDKGTLIYKDLENRIKELKKLRRACGTIDRRIEYLSQQPFPFANTYDWAVFICSGLN